MVPRRPAEQNTPTMTSTPTPDPGQGLFETLLVAGGKPVELDAHLDRLGASLRTLFGVLPPAGIADDAREAARPMQLGRLRITVDQIAASPRARLAVEAVEPADLFPAWERGADLRSLRCEGGLGHHKWSDRRRLGDAADGTVPLLLDRGDEVLEAGRGNLFAAFGEELLTPASDGRILPGIARAGAIAAAREAGIEVAERRLLRDDLFAADGVFLTGSVRGVEPARSLDGALLPAGTDLSRRVGDSLRRRWLGGPRSALRPSAA
jgi:para-aminobenzoate synthetase / 4-amino-4-deoxychorismate lyase